MCAAFLSSFTVDCRGRPCKKFEYLSVLALGVAILFAGGLGVATAAAAGGTVAVEPPPERTETRATTTEAGVAPSQGIGCPSDSVRNFSYSSRGAVVVGV